MKKLILSALVAILLPMFGAGAAVQYWCGYTDYVTQDVVDGAVTIPDGTICGFYADQVKYWARSGTSDVKYNPGDVVTIPDDTTGDMYFYPALVYTFDCDNGIVHKEVVETSASQSVSVYPPSIDICNFPADADECEDAWVSFGYNWNPNVSKSTCNGIMGSESDGRTLLDNGYAANTSYLYHGLPERLIFHAQPMCPIKLDPQGGTFTFNNESLEKMFKFYLPYGCDSIDYGTMGGAGYVGLYLELYRDMCYTNYKPEECAWLQQNEFAFTNPGQRLVGWNTRPYGNGEYEKCDFVWNDAGDNIESFTCTSNCTWPECKTLYAVWTEKTITNPAITIDFNGGGMELDLFYLTEFPLTMDDDPKNDMYVDKNLISEEFTFDGSTITLQDMAAMVMDMAENPNASSSVSRPGYKLVGFSADPDTPGVYDCVYPDCHTYYAMWEPMDVTTPGIYVDYNGGEFTWDWGLLGNNGNPTGQIMHSTKMIVAPENAPDLVADFANTDLMQTLAPEITNIINVVDAGEIPTASFIRTDADGGIYTFIGFSADKDEIVSECVYPDCNMIYAIWAKKEYPALTIDFNGGTFNQNGATSYVIYESNAPELKELEGVDWVEPVDDADIEITLDKAFLTVELNAIYGNITRPGYRFLDLSTDKNTDVQDSCVYPECNTLYIVWEREEYPSIYLDMNGGTFNIPEEVFEGLISGGITTTKFPYVDVYNDTLAQLSEERVDIWNTDFYGTDSSGQANNDSMLMLYQEMPDVFTHPNGYKLLGLSPNPYHLESNPTCIYPDCNTFYAIWDVPMCPVAKNLSLGNGTKIPLHSDKITSPSLALQYKGQICYANMAPDAKSDTINVKYKGKVYHAE